MNSRAALTTSGAQEVAAPIWTPTAGKALVLRTVAPDRRSYNNFLWPADGPVECPDWLPTTACGNGLHGALWGDGDGSLLRWEKDALWQVVEIDADSAIDLTGKVKFPAGVVIYTGNQTAAVALVAHHAPNPGAVIANHSSTTGADAHSSTTGDYAHSSTTGDYAHSSTTGDYAVATSLALGATASAGENGTIVLAWKDPAGRLRIAVGYPGEDGIRAGVTYRADSNGELVEVGKTPTNRAVTVVADYEISGEQIRDRNEAFKVINLAAERAKRAVAAADKA